jgi:mannose-6-phosphate isomerase-like protein (cupin superfamily)
MSKGFIKMNHPFLDDMDDLERSDNQMNLMDYGPEPFAANIEELTLANNNYRTALWTGKNLQVTLMSINVGEDIGLELHTTHDQFLRIEEGSGIVQMGDSRENLDFQRRVSDGFAVIVPAGKWHNLINTGDTPLKLYSIYAPPQHPHGTVHKTKAMAEAAEEAVN